MKGTFCGARRTGIAMLVFLFTLVAPAAALADLGVGGVSAPAPSLPAVPAAPVAAPAAVPALPGVPSAPAAVATPTTAVAVPAVPGAVRPAVGVAKPAAAVAKAAARTAVTVAKPKLAVRPKVSVKVGVKAKPATVKGHIKLFDATPDCNSTGSGGTGTNCTNLPLEGDFDNTCNHNDIVQILPGSTYHTKTTATFDPVRMVLSMTTFTNWQQVHGIGLSSAVPYSAMDIQRTYSKQIPVVPSLGLVQITNDLDDRQDLLSHGSLPNQLMTVSTHTVVQFNPLAPLTPITIEDSFQKTIKCTG
jgi:hypothetical protein